MEKLQELVNELQAAEDALHNRLVQLFGINRHSDFEAELKAVEAVHDKLQVLANQQYVAEKQPD